MLEILIFFVKFLDLCFKLPHLRVKVLYLLVSFIDLILKLSQLIFYLFNFFSRRCLIFLELFFLFHKFDFRELHLNFHVLKLHDFLVHVLDLLLFGSNFILEILLIFLSIPILQSTSVAISILDLFRRKVRHSIGTFSKLKFASKHTLLVY
jgi:hypothetical protein